MSRHNSTPSSSKQDSSNFCDNDNRAPKHLRGRAIGFWYARRSKQRKIDNETLGSKYEIPEYFKGKEEEKTPVNQTKLM